MLLLLLTVAATFAANPATTFVLIFTITAATMTTISATTIVRLIAAEHLQQLLQH